MVFRKGFAIMNRRLWLFASYFATWALALLISQLEKWANWTLVALISLLVIPLSLLLGKMLKSYADATTSSVSKFTVLFFIIYPVILAFLEFGFIQPYKFWANFGADSMKTDKKIVPLGDLVHITGAAHCANPPIVGAQVCDPWERPLNQNPLVINIFHELHLTNVLLVGVSSYFLFALIVLAYVRERRVAGIALPLFLCTSPVILAIERGNEIITLFLILAGFLLLQASPFTYQIFGASFLSAAAIFKLWPVVLVCSLIILLWKSLSKLSIFIMSLSVVYWILHLSMALKIVDATQSGSIAGLSFGFKLFRNVPFSSLFVLLFLLISAYCIYIIFSFSAFGNSSELLKGRFEGAYLHAVFVTYFCICALGSNFAYRLIVLLPGILILSRQEFSTNIWARNSMAFILITATTAKFPIFNALSSALALYLMTFVIVAILNHLKITQRSRG